MSVNKTQATEHSVEDYLVSLSDPIQQQDCYTLLNIMQTESGEAPKMWGDSMIGFGRYHYRYESGREGDFFRMGFSPRKGKLALYIMPGVNQFADLLNQLGKYKTGKSCLYIKSLVQVDTKTLRELIAAAWLEMAKRYP